MTVDRAENISSLQASLELKETYKEQGERFLKFSFNSNINILVSLADLKGVVKLSIKDIMPVPEMTKYWLGITNWRGKAVWILDLASLLGTIHWCERKKVADCGIAMLVQFQQQNIGLLVEEISTIETFFSEEKLATSSAMLPENLRSFLPSYFIDPQGRPLLILDLHNTIAAIY